MKKLLNVLMVVVVTCVVCLLMPGQSFDAQATCHECIIQDPPHPPLEYDEDCLTTDAGPYGSCYEKVIYDYVTGEEKSDYCVTTASSSCPVSYSGGDGDDDHDPIDPSWGDPDECTAWWDGCPAWCSTCSL